MEFSAGERFQIVREMLDFTREDFAKLTGIPFTRLRNIEHERTILNVEDFQKLAAVLPELLPWIIYEGDINLDDLRASKHPQSRVMAEIFEQGRQPGGRMPGGRVFKSRFKRRK